MGFTEHETSKAHGEKVYRGPGREQDDEWRRKMGKCQQSRGLPNLTSENTVQITRRGRRLPRPGGHGVLPAGGAPKLRTRERGFKRLLRAAVAGRPELGQAAAPSLRAYAWSQAPTQSLERSSNISAAHARASPGRPFRLASLRD